MANFDRGNATRRKDEEMAARLKREGVVRTTGRCAQCYAIISVDSTKSRYVHVCRG